VFERVRLNRGVIPVVTGAMSAEFQCDPIRKNHSSMLIRGIGPVQLRYARAVICTAAIAELG